jgi:hypothetical protein
MKIHHKQEPSSNPGRVLELVVIHLIIICTRRFQTNIPGCELQKETDSWPWSAPAVNHRISQHCRRATGSIRVESSFPFLSVFFLLGCIQPVLEARLASILSYSTSLNKTRSDGPHLPSVNQVQRSPVRFRVEL